jgi:hypothetical protein
MDEFSDYFAAYKHAQAQANYFKRPMALEKGADLGGREVFRVKHIPKNPRFRFGWETRCQVVEPNI